MSLVLYLLTALPLLWVLHRFALSMSRAAALSLLLFPLCFTGRALLTGGAYGPFDLPYQTVPLHSIRARYGISHGYNGALHDVYTQMIPYRQAVREKVMQLEWPLWNPHTLCGELPGGGATPAAFSPFPFLAAFLPTSISFTYSASIFFFLAAVSLFVFARDLGCGEPAARFGAAGWMGATAITFYNLWTIGGAWGVFPLVLARSRRIVRDPGARSMAILISGLSICILAGHPESILHVVSLGIAYGIYELIRAPRERRVPAVGFAVASGALTLLVTAIYLLPLVDALPQTHDYASRKNMAALQPQGVDLPEACVRLTASIFSTMENRIWKGENPNAIPPETAGVGSIVLAAAVYALSRLRHRDKWFFAALLLFTLVAYSEWKPFAALLHKLPLFDVAINGRYSFGAACLLTILGAFGVEELLTRKDSIPFAANALATLFVVAIGSSFLESRSLTVNGNMWGDFRMLADVALLAIVVLLVAAHTPAHVAAPLLVALVLLQRTMQEESQVPVSPPASAYPPVPLFEPLKSVSGPYRIVGEGMAFVPGASAMYGLEDVRGYSAMILRELWNTYPLWCRVEPVSFNRVEGEALTRPFLSFLNTRFGIIIVYMQTPKGWHDVLSYGHARLIENDNVIERAFVPRRVRVGYDEKETLEQMKNETDFRERAWLDSKSPPRELWNGPGVVSIERRRNGDRMDATRSDDAWPAAAGRAWAGWGPAVDGQPAEIRNANIAFLGIRVPKGRHKVNLIYRPRSFVIGRALTLARLAPWLLSGLAKFLHQRRNRLLAPLSLR